MTREQNFRSTFIPQLVTYSSWQNIPHKELRKLPLSLFPAFSVDLAKTKYTKYDLTGKAIGGEQEFTVTVYYELPLYNVENAYLDHSDITNIIEQFINNPVYSPPAIVPGDTCCIHRCELVDVKAPAITLSETRFSASLTGKYIFTIF